MGTAFSGRHRHDEVSREIVERWTEDPRHPGGNLGVTAVLHTWSQTLARHVHLYCVITPGALAPGGARWIPVRNGFLFPVRVVSRVFRGKFLAELDRAQEDGRLATHRIPRRLRRELHRHDWVVYCRPPLAGPEHLVKYLGRYTHRVAIYNDRILSHEDGVVGFSWRDRTNGDRRRVMRTSAVEFLRRFLLQVLADGFQRIRHYGLHANRRDHAMLELCRALLGATPAAPATTETTAGAVLRLTGIDILHCPACGQGRLRTTLRLAPSSIGTGPPPWDTS